MRSNLTVLFIGILVLGACREMPTEQAGPQDETDLARFGLAAGQERVRVIVRLRTSSDRDAVAQEARGLGATIRRQYQRYPYLALEVNETALRGLLRSPRVISVLEDAAGSTLLSTSLGVIGADQVHSLGWDGSTLSVVILDTGIVANHPFVVGRVPWEVCFSSDGSDEEPLCPNGQTAQEGPGAASINVPNCMINSVNRCDHGMHVAGIAAGDGTNVTGAPPAGVAPGADIIAIQVFSRIVGGNDCDPNPAPCLMSFESDQLAALEYVIDHLGPFNVAAVNMSIGGGMFTESCDDESALTDAMRDLIILNIPTIVGAGNSGFTDAVAKPACVSWALRVGATDNADNVATFSNRGLMLDFFAPGVNITSSAENGGFESKQGTSMATPHVTGAWAVLREAAPGASFNDVFFALADNGIPISFASGSQTVTKPRIDLLAALQGSTQPPVLTVDELNVAADEGSFAFNTGTFIDPDGDPVTLVPSIGIVVKSGGNWSWSFGTKDGPAENQVVFITATDNKGASDLALFALDVINVAPTVQAGPDATVVSGDPFNLSGTFLDPGLIDFPWSWKITWGDGAQTNGSTNVQTAPVTASHPFCAVGGYTVALAVTDKDGATGSDDLTVTVGYHSVVIDITPGGNPNPVNLNGNKLLPVAILSTATFDAVAEVDPGTVVLGDEVGPDTPLAQRNNGTNLASAADVNGDGLIDLVLQFPVPDLVANGDLTSTSSQLVLRGFMTDGCTNFRGVDAVVVVP